jgi:hypothetical protein
VLAQAQPGEDDQDTAVAGQENLFLVAAPLFLTISVKLFMLFNDRRLDARDQAFFRTVRDSLRVSLHL